MSKKTWFMYIEFRSSDIVCVILFNERLVRYIRCPNNTMACSHVIHSFVMPSFVIQLMKMMDDNTGPTWNNGLNNFA